MPDDYPLLKKKLSEKGFDDEDIADIVRVVESCCSVCWEQEKPCTCMRDE